MFYARSDIDETEPDTPYIPPAISPISLALRLQLALGEDQKPTRGVERKEKEGSVSVDEPTD